VTASVGTGATKARQRRGLWWALSISVVLHLWLTPAAAWLGVLSWLLETAPKPESPAEQLHSIPITWLGPDEPPPAEPAAQNAPVAMLESPQLSSPEPAPAPQSQTPKLAKPETPPQDKPRSSEGGAPDIDHPLALSGIKTQLLDDNANVNLLLVSERVRAHPLGARIGKLLVDFPQWSSFFATAEINPIRDLNRILIVGPEFRRSADMVAIIEHRLGSTRVHAAVDRLVRRPPRGHWLEGKIPMARAHADRAERLFAIPSADVLVVAPLHLEQQLLGMPPVRFPTPEGKEALVLHVRAPAQALRELPFALPGSLRWLRLDLTPLEGGAASLRVSAEDSDARSAAQHARSLSNALNAITNPDLGALGALIGLRSIAFLDRIELQARGARIYGQLHISEHQLDRLLGYTEQMVADWKQPR
jgi:hypothetical protein